MKIDCEVIRDLLPLYADNACSKKSRDMVEEHLEECTDCRSMLHSLQETELENNLRNEKDEVIENGAKWFRRRSAAVGSAVSGVFMIPLLVCLIISITSGLRHSWYYVLAASLLVAASLIIVPLMVPEDKAFWTFCSFCVSLMVLLGVICLYTHGTWFWIASSATLFGLSVVFLPFLLRARPVRELIGSTNRLLVTLGVDAVLFVNMMNTIRMHGRISRMGFLYKLGIIAGIALLVMEVMKNRRMKK